MKTHPVLGVIMLDTRFPRLLGDIGHAGTCGHIRAAGASPGGDFAAAKADAVLTALALLARSPWLRTMVLECTNLPPCAAAIERHTGCCTVSLLQPAPLLRALSNSSYRSPFFPSPTP